MLSSVLNFWKRQRKLLGGRIDCLVSNAGVSLHENINTNVTIEGFDKQFKTKFRAGYFLSKAFLEMKTKEKVEGLLNSQILYITFKTGDQVYDIPYGMTNGCTSKNVQDFMRLSFKNQLFFTCKDGLKFQE